MVPFSGQDLRFIILLTVYVGLWFQRLCIYFPDPISRKQPAKPRGPPFDFLEKKKANRFDVAKKTRSSGHREAKEPTGRSGHKMSAKGLISNFAPWRKSHWPCQMVRWFCVERVVVLLVNLATSGFFGWSKGHDWKKLVDYKMFYPRHPGPPPEVRYLDPKNKKNIPKAALQEVFGRLGSCLKL